MRRPGGAHAFAFLAFFFSGAGSSATSSASATFSARGLKTDWIGGPAAMNWAGIFHVALKSVVNELKTSAMLSLRFLACRASSGYDIEAQAPGASLRDVWGGKSANNNHNGIVNVVAKLRDAST